MLIAHNGFGFDYLFLKEEIKRHSLEEYFDTIDLWFADTLFDTRRVSIVTDFLYGDCIFLFYMVN